MKKQKTLTVLLLIFSCLIIWFVQIPPLYAQRETDDLSFYTPPVDSNPYPLVEQRQIKNIILMIGDGMSITPITAARIKVLGADGKLHIERMPVTGFINTHSVNRLITDSAASATALASGYKTNNGMIGMIPDGTKVYTILEAVRDKGMSTGLVATSTITHATPAAFAAHVRLRSNQTAIAYDIIANRVNVILGGGKSFFIPQSSRGSKRKDNLDLINEARKVGYEFVQTKSEFDAAKSDFLLGLFHIDAMTTEPPEPTLTEMTAKAIEILSRNANGFFLMVEGSQIDWAEHDNDADEAIRQMLHFDLVVKQVVDFAMENGETIVVITADHETGGMTINSGRLSGENLSIKWTTGGHTGVPVPIFAYGPHAERFMGWYDNTEVPKIFAELLRITDFSIK